MSTRRQDNTSAMENLGARVRQRALSGTEASTVGFVLVGYIGAGAGLGYLLDSYFKTSWMIAVGVLLGAVVGFREMYRMTQRLTRQSITSDAETERAKISASQQINTPFVERTVEPTQIKETSGRKRIFTVPPPPFETAGSMAETQLPQKEDELIERLLESDEPEDVDEPNIDKQ